MSAFVDVGASNKFLLDIFLIILSGKKCTYGNKCKFYHPERSRQAQLSVADELRAKIKVPLSLRREEEKCNHSPCRTGREPAPCDACTETVRDTSSCAGASCYPGWPQGSCPGQPSRAWASGPSSDLGLDQQLLQIETLPDQPLLEKMSALSISDDTYSCNWSTATSRTDSPHRCSALRHAVCLLPHPHSLDHARLPAGAFQQGVFPPAQDRMGPDHSWSRDCCGVHGMDQRSHCIPDGARHKHALATQQHLLPHLHNARQLQQQHPSRPPWQPSLLDFSNRQGFFQGAHAYHDASFSDYWPTPAAKPPTAQQASLCRELCSLFPYSEVNHVMALYPHIKDIASLALLIQRHRNL